MKLFSRTLMKIAPVKLAALSVLLMLGATATARAQNPRIQTSQLDGLAVKASETVDVNIDESLIALTAKFLSSKDDDEKKVMKVNMKYADYTRTDIVTAEPEGKGWKITKVETSFK